jgi:RNA polymerase sigma factor (sigma-70 family)
MIAASCATADAELVTAVREGDDASFEELYRRYQPRIAAFVRSRLRDEARAEDVTQEAFLSALRRLRVTDSEINFKPWIYEIARNAAIDSHRRSSRAEEISMDAGSGLRPSDRLRLVGDSAPDSALIDRERFDHLRGAFDELSDVHARVLVMRELEGCSYREIGEKLDLTRPAVESALFRARRRLETEYAELSEGRRCRKARAIIARLAEGMDSGVDHQRLARHARRCHGCRRWARELGVEPQAAPSSLRAKVAALLPLPFPWLPSGAHLGAGLGERAAALIAAAALAGAGGAAIGGSGLLERDPAKPAAIERETVGERTTHQATPSAGSPRSSAHKRDRDDQARRSADPARAKRDAGPGDAATGAPAAGGAADGPAAGPGHSAPLGGAGLPDVPDAPDAPDVRLPGADVPTDGRLPRPELPEVTVPLEPPQVAPGVSVPEVSVPEVGTGTIDGVSGAVQDALP